MLPDWGDFYLGVEWLSSEQQKLEKFDCVDPIKYGISFRFVFCYLRYVFIGLFYLAKVM